jgi:hypothetical protein
LLSFLLRRYSLKAEIPDGSGMMKCRIAKVGPFLKILGGQL